MKKSTVRIFAIVLVVLMCLSLLPLAAAHAMEYPAEMPEIPGFTWMGDHYVETEHIYGEVANEDFLVDESEPGDCETPALYWRSCINRNPFTEERCGVTAETAYQEALQRAANDLNMQKSSGVQHTDSEWQDIWNRTAEEILNRYTFYYGGFGHQWVEVEYQPATCEQDGWETYHYCSACGEGLDYIPLIPATGHRYEDGICAVCGKADPDYAPVASSDNAPLTLSDSASFNSDEPVEEQGNEPLPNNDEIPVGNADGNVVITYNANGGAEADYTQDITADATDATLTPCGFTREHYEFIGWNTAEDGSGDSFIDQQDVTAASFSETAVTLYAQWRMTEITITFERNGADDGSMSTQDIPVDHSEKLNENKYTRRNYAFTGWNTAADGSGESFTDGWEVTAADFDQYPEHKLYAQWVRISVTFYPNEGSGSPFTQDLDVISNPLTANPFTRNGFRFTGWNTDANGLGQPYKDQEMVSTDKDTMHTYVGTPINLYAQWQKRIDIVYQSNGGKKSTTDTHYAGDIATVMDLAATGIPEKDKRTFSGEWNTNPKGGDDTAYLPGTPIPLTNNTDTPIMLYAQWNFTVNFNANGGTGSMDPIADAREYRELALPANTAITREGYRFDSWNTQSNGKGIRYEDADTVPAENMSGPFVLYAQWVEEYKITFKGNNATSGTMEPVGGIKDENVDLPTNEFKRDGYSFIGWNTKEDGTGTSYEDGATVTITDNMDLYAQWEQVFSVTFDENSGSGTAPEAISVKNGGTATLPTNTLTRVGYEPNGWNTKADGTGTHYDDGATISDVSADTPLFAEWIQVFSVSFDTNNGIGTSPATIHVNKNGTTEALPENTLTRDGYAPNGWNTKANGTGTHYNAGDTISNVTADIPLYAEWDQLYTVVFNRYISDSDTTTEEQSIRKSEISTATLTPFTELNFSNTGKVFEGWSKTKGGSLDFEDQDSIQESDFTSGRLNLYARWKNFATVTFDKNSTAATGTMDPMKVTDEAKPLTANAFTRTGYQFMGWNTDKNGDGTAFEDEENVDTSVIIADVTLYAQWSKIFKIQYMSNGGSGIMPNQEALSGIELEIAANGFTKTGADFDSWNTKADGSGKTYKAGDKYTFKETDSDLTLYAQWTYTVTFDPNGGTGYIVEGNTDKAFEKQDYDIPENMSEGEEPKPLITKTGYAFNGWNTKADGTGDKYADGGTIPASKVTGPITLYAQWDQEYKVDFKNTADASQTMEPQIILKSVLDKAGTTGVALNANEFTYTDHIFIGWDILDKTGKVKFKDKDPVKLSNFEEVHSTILTLYAQWEDEVIITFHDGSLTDKQSVPKNKPATLKANPFKKSGYFFGGWYYNPELTDPTGGIADKGEVPGDKLQDDLNLYARWLGPVYMTGSITGSDEKAYVGETLTAYVDNAADITDFTYQWDVYDTIDGKTTWYKIPGATHRSYVPTNEYNGKLITCVVTRLDADGKEVKIKTNDKTVTNKLTSVTFKQDLIDVVNEQAASTYAQPGQIQGVTKNMQYSTDGGYSWSDVTNVSDAGVMSVLKPGTYIFRIKDIKGASIESDPVVIDRWFTFSYTTSNTTSTSTSSSGNTSSSTGSGTVQLQWNGKSMPTNTSPTTTSPDVVKYSGGTNMWLVREGTDDVITMTIRPSSGSYGHWNINGGSYANVSSESTITVTPLNGPEHYNIIFNRSSSSPRTADESHLGLWSALCLISLTGAAAILGKTFKRKKTR